MIIMKKVLASHFLFLVLISSLILGSLSLNSNSTLFKINPSNVHQISWKPRAFVYQGFLTDEECDHLISINLVFLVNSPPDAKKELKRSAVTDNESGNSQLSEGRTSSGAFISWASDAIVQRIEEKIAIWTFQPTENGEDIQVLRYEEGQKYEAHFDFFLDKVNLARGGHRYATVLMYLSNVEKGGETVFPNAELSEHQKAALEANDDFSECAKKGIAVKPRKGDALLFFNLHPNATTDELSLHGGCPVIEGEKWSATKWIRVVSLDKILDDGCNDHDHNCERWAELGECTRYLEYMVGTNAVPGYCRKSCKAC